VIRRGLALAVVALLACAGPARSAEISGKRPQVVDGDTLVLAGAVVDLAGIDAPELAQGCRRGGAAWPCGEDARFALIDRIGLNWVVCVPERGTAGGALAAVCHLGGIGGPELNAWMVAKGWALADRGAGARYAREESAARRAKRGLWSGELQAPWDWRAGQ